MLRIRFTPETIDRFPIAVTILARRWAVYVCISAALFACGAQHTVRANTFISAKPASWLNAYSDAPSIWTTVPLASATARFQTQAYHLPRSTDIEIQPAGSRGKFTHLRFSVCMLGGDDKYVAARAYTPPNWSLADASRRRGKATVTLEVYDKIGDRFATVIEESISELYKSLQFDLKLPFELTAGQCVARIDVVLGDDTQALVYGIAPYRQQKKPRHLVLLSLDTHAMQHMSLSGDLPFDTSPALRELVQQDPRARLYSGAVAVSSWTLPTHATIFTGLYPTQHGLIDQDVVAEFSEKIQTLPKLLQSHGVETYHLAAHTRVGFTYGYHRGVDHYRQYEQPLGRRGRHVLKDATRLLEDACDHDVFMFAHLFDAHLPYTNYPANYRSYYRGPAPRSPDALCKGPLYRDKIFGDKGWKPSKRAAHVKQYGKQLKPDMEAARVAYRLGIRDVDDMVRDFIGSLKRAGTWEQTSLIIVADHGEEFFEHGLLTHTSLYQENLDVPFIIRLGANVDVSGAMDDGHWNLPYVFEAHTTAYRVALDLFGVELPDYIRRAGTHGLSLSELANLRAHQPAFAEFYVLPKSKYHEASLITGNQLKIILSTDLANSGKWRERDVHVQLYDLKSDARNLRNVFDPADQTHQMARQRVVDQARKIRKLRFPPVSRGKLTPEQIKKLRALGYIH